MNIALFYENVSPARGGCETYISDLTRRLVADGHEVHLYAARWDSAALPASLQAHAIEVPRGPRFLKPWRFGEACLAAMRQRPHDLTIGFDKTWGQDILYPQGGLHVASAEYNLRKFRSPLTRGAARWAKRFDPAAISFRALERKQYLGADRPTIIVNSFMVQRHFERFYGIPASRTVVVRSAIDPGRFHSMDRPRIRTEWRSAWEVGPDVPVGLFVAMNYRLKGLEPLIRAVARMPAQVPFRLAVVGHPRFQRCRRLAQHLGVAHRINFHGFCADTKNAYFASDFLVHPTFYDPCSLVALEALACGLPVITTQYNGASEILNPPDDGLVIRDPHDSQSLADAMVHMCDPAYRARAGTAARAAAARWTFDDHYRTMMEVFTAAASRGPASAPLRAI